MDINSLNMNSYKTIDESLILRVSNNVQLMFNTPFRMTTYKLPQQVKPIYNVLYNQIKWFSAIWNELKYLFSNFFGWN